MLVFSVYFSKSVDSLTPQGKQYDIFSILTVGWSVLTCPHKEHCIRQSILRYLRLVRSLCKMSVSNEQRCVIRYDRSHQRMCPDESCFPIGEVFAIALLNNQQKSKICNENRRRSSKELIYCLRTSCNLITWKDSNEEFLWDENK